MDAFIGMMRGAGVDLSFITKESLRNQFYSDLITPLPDAIDPAGTEIHILYALKMGEKYRARYHRHLRTRYCMNWTCSMRSFLQYIRRNGWS